MNPLVARAVRLRIHQHVVAMMSSAVQPDPAERFLSVGPDPLRVLILGGGFALGVGVTSRALALDGQLGARLAEASGRGVTTTNTGSAGSRLREQMFRGYGRADLVVWCPSFLELTERAPSRRWFSDLQELIAAMPTALVLIVELPRLRGRGRAVRIADEAIEQLNTRLRGLDRADAVVRTVQPPAVDLNRDAPPPLHALNYAEVGRTAADVVLPLMRSSRTASPRAGGHVPV